MIWLEGSHVSSYLFERKAFAHMSKLAADRLQRYLNNNSSSSLPSHDQKHDCEHDHKYELSIPKPSYSL